MELFRKQGYAATSSCAIRDWKAKGGPLEPVKPAPAGPIK